MTEEQTERLLAALELIGENLEKLSDGVWEISFNLDLLTGEHNGNSFLRILDVGRE